MRRNNKLLVIMLIFAMLLLVGCNGDGDSESASEPDTSSDVVGVAETEGDFKILLEALEKAGMLDMLNGIGPYTIFAPGDPIFEAYFEEQGITKEEFLASDDLESILKHHIAEDIYDADRLSKMDGKTITTLDGAEITVSVDEDGNILFNGTVSIIQPDFVATNGVVHAIDKLIP